VNYSDKVFAIFIIVDKYVPDYFQHTGQSRLRHLLKRIFITDIEVYNRIISFKFLQNETVIPTNNRNMSIISNIVLIEGISYEKFKQDIPKSITDINLGILYVVDPEQLTTEHYGEVQFKI